MMAAIRKKRRVVWIDEVIFSDKCVQMKEWTPATIHVRIPSNELKQKVVRLIYGYSKMKGTEVAHFV